VRINGLQFTALFPVVLAISAAWPRPEWQSPHPRPGLARMRAL